MSTKCPKLVSVYVPILVLALPLLHQDPAEGAELQPTVTVDRVLRPNLAPMMEVERQNFKALLFGNPNYFGTLPDSPFTPVKLLQANTKYEELKCVGYNADLETLEAVVYVKQTYGYSGGICTSGSPEFVRFYVDYGSGWQDQGIVSFNAYDIPGPKPLEYAVTLQINPSKRFCFFENLPTVRAILSWNNAPPANQPNWKPIWGNVVDARIQIEPATFVIIKDILAAAKIKFPLPLESIVDLNQPLEVKKAAPLDGVELHQLYKEKTKVEPYRYLYSDIQKLAAPSVLDSGVLPSKGLLPDLPGIDWPKVFEKKPLLVPDLDIPKVITALLQTDGNTNYEELGCIGLDTRLDRLVGVVNVKLPNGYSGGLCSSGSTEYVAFWVDWDGTGSWDYVGTGEITVHDIHGIPPEGLKYAVSIPVDVATHRRLCFLGAKTAKVRAILSWETSPPPSNPNWRPTWGNREETLVHIVPGIGIPAGEPVPEIYIVGGMSPNDIDSDDTGWGNGAAVLAGFTAVDSPFGGIVSVAGKIHNAPDLSSGASEYEYRISIREHSSGSWQPLNDPLRVELIPWPGGIGAAYKVTLTATDGWYAYKADAVPPTTTDINGLLLAKWDTGSKEGLWDIKMDARDSAGVEYPGSQVVTIYLDNEAPDPVAITITSGGGPCADFSIGDKLSGTYSAFDDHFLKLRLSVSPSLSGGVLSPVERSYPTVSGSGESGTWTLNTSGMPRCGYVVGIRVWDRTIVNSGYIGRDRYASVGLCLREK